MRKRVFMLAASAACLCFSIAAFGAQATTVTNRWIGVSGGKLDDRARFG